MTKFYQTYNVVEKLKVLDQAYGNKKDKAGLALWLHALRMAQVVYLSDLKQKAELIDTALFHDYLEDADQIKEFADLKKYVTDPVFEAVKILTRWPGQTYMDYIDQVINSKNYLAIQVKKLDLLDHIIYGKDITTSLLKRYEKAIDKFKDLE